MIGGGGSILAGLAMRARKTKVRWPGAIAFSVAGVIGALIGAAAGKAVDGQSLLALFGLVMLVLGASMLRAKPQDSSTSL